MAIRGVMTNSDQSGRPWPGYVLHAATNWLKSARRRLRRRYARQTILGHLADALGLCLWGYSIAYIAHTSVNWLPTSANGQALALRAFSPGGVAFALTLMIVLRLLPRRILISKRWKDEEVRVSYAAATQIVTDAVRHGIVTEASFKLLVVYALQGITSEMARMFSDSEDTYFNCFLWEQDPQHQEQLRIVGCAKPEVDLDPSYSKDDLLTWRAMSKKATVYDPDRPSGPYGPWRHYRAVIAFPLRDSDGEVIAGVSVKSKRPYHFSSETETIHTTLQPGFLLLALALECRSKLGSFRDMEAGEC
jgi:hypothetical protein